MKPYIGITDFTKRDQVLEMLEIFKKHKPENSNKLLHVGVMTSYKVLKGIHTKWERTYPLVNEIEGVFSYQEPDVYNCLHYVDYDDKTKIWDLVQLVELAGKNINSIQLDMPWPKPFLVRKLQTMYSDLEIILQVGGIAMQRMDNNPILIVEKLEEYPNIKRVLLDKSMGQGLPLDPQFLIPFAREIQKEFPSVLIGVAGGLGPNTLDSLLPIVEEFPNISIDAQSKLRPSGNSLDPLDLNMAARYIISALNLLI